MNSANVRNSNVELLRIIAALGVIMLHFNGNVGGALEVVQIGSLSSGILVIFEVIFSVAVNVFLLIFGYYQVNRKEISIIKPVNLITYVIYYRVLTYLFEILLGFEMFQMNYFISRFVPLNYYIILYCCIYILSPYINKLINVLDEQELKKLIGSLFILFSVWVFFVDAIQNISGFELMGLSSIGLEGSQKGYTIVNFFLLYVLGAYIRKKEENARKMIEYKKIVFGLVSCWILLGIWKYGTMYYSMKSSVLDYCNPIVIISAIFSFLLFRNMNIGSSKGINTLSKAAFTVYLVHPFFLKIFVPFVSMDSVKVVPESIGVCVIIYICCFGVYKSFGIICDKICEFESFVFIKWKLYRRRKFF